MSDPMAVPQDVPAGLPDAASLARMAAEFFAAWPAPGAPSPVAANPHPAGVSLPPGIAGPATPSAVPLGAYPPGANLATSNPQSAASALATAPNRLPRTVAGNALPDHAVTAAPALEGRPGGAALGVPQAYAAALPFPAFTPRASLAAPQAAGEAAAAPAAFYFLAAPDAGAAAAPDASSALLAALKLPSFEAAPASVPQAPVARDPAAPARGAAPAPSSAPGFYFLDAPVAGVPGGSAGPAPATDAHPPFDVHAIRRDFPILSERVNGRPLVWFDNAATTQKPQAVIDRLAHFYAHENSNIHRAAHELAARATDAYEKARETVRRFLGAGSTEEIVFVRGTTEAINLVAKSWGARHVGAGDEIVVSHLEHHANIVPWQQLAAEKGARLRVIPVDDAGQVRLDEYQRLLGDRTRLVAVTQVSNALGTVVPVREIVELAHRAGARALVDGAQSVSHMSVDVQSLGADFFVFSGHKIFGPTGIGALYGRREVLEDMPPWEGGGNMITDVTFERTLYQKPPQRFEAGTGNIADAVGLGAALEYVERVGRENIARYEHALLEYATRHLGTIPGLRLIGTAPDKASVSSFVLAGYTTDEVGQALNREGIAVRTGHHCAQPILRRFGLETSVRPSLAFYNTCDEIDRMIGVLRALAGARR
jgi:cysteine desulfurase/selenocysteine lyase